MLSMSAVTMMTIGQLIETLCRECCNILTLFSNEYYMEYLIKAGVNYTKYCYHMKL
jgi:hypothetical protein